VLKFWEILSRGFKVVVVQSGGTWLSCVCVCVDVNTAVPLVDQPDEAEVLATRPMSYVLAVDNGIYHTPRVCLSVCYMT